MEVRDDKEQESGKRSGLYGEAGLWNVEGGAMWAASRSGQELGRTMGKKIGRMWVRTLDGEKKPDSNPGWSI